MLEPTVHLIYDLSIELIIYVDNGEECVISMPLTTSIKVTQKEN